MDLTEDRIASLTGHGKTKAQKDAITMALTELRDQLIIETPQRSGLAVPTTDLVMVVVSGTGTTNADANNLTLALSHGREKYASMTVVTCGHKGMEVAAEDWANQRQIPVMTYAPVFQVPQGDGTTQYQGNARSVRLGRLKKVVADCVAAGRTVVVADFGVESDNDKITGALVRAGAKALPWSRHWVAPTADPAAVAQAMAPTPSEEEPSAPISVDVAEAEEAPAHL